MIDTDQVVGTTVDDVAGWFDRHAASLAGYANRRVGSSTAKDVVADTFRIALEQRSAFDPRRGDERAWLYGIATNLIRRHWRTEERRLRTQTRSLAADTRQVDPLLDLVDAVDARRSYDRVVEAVIRLDPDDRDLLVLVAWEGMTSAEAAAVLGVPPGTVRSRLHRIRTRLADARTEGLAPERSTDGGSTDG
jgi:RNA polymerase sigma factor (sigma-70 family)